MLQLVLEIAMMVLALLYGVNMLIFQAALEDKGSARPQSIERYHATTRILSALMAMIVAGALLGTIIVLVGWGPVSIPLFAASALWMIPLKEHLDDDNWFNSQRQRLGDKLQRLGERLMSTPTPKPT